MKRNYPPSPETDIAIAASKRSKTVQHVTQTVGTLMAVSFGYKAGANMDLVLNAGLAAGVGVTAFGTRLGIERGSAMRRNQERHFVETVVGPGEYELRHASLNGSRTVGSIGPVGFAVAAGIFAEMGSGDRAIENEAHAMNKALGLADKSSDFIHNSPFSPNTTLAIAGLALVGSVVGQTLTESSGWTFENRPHLHRIIGVAE